MRFINPFIYIVTITAIGAIVAILWFGISFRQFEKITPIGDMAGCTPVIGIYGAADIEPISDSAAAYLASFDRRGNAVRGAILRFDINDPLDDGSWRDRTGGDPVLFEPMGIDLYHAKLPDGRWLTRLFVVNLAGPEVLLYDVDANGDLLLRERFSEPRLTSPNDVVATGPRSFYVTNDTSARHGSLRGRFDFLLGLKTGKLLEYDGTSWADVADGLAYPNGLALSPDGTQLLLAEMRAKALVKFDRDVRTDVLVRGASISLDTFPDNIAFDKNGHVLIGAAPQPLTFSAYNDGLRDTSPSQIIRVTQSGIVETVYQDTGEILSAATVGVPVGGKLLIGSRDADRFLMCDAG